MRRFFRFSVPFSLLSLAFWSVVYFESRRNERFALYGTLDGIPLGLVLKGFKVLRLHETVSFTVLCALGVSLLFWNFLAFVFSIRLKWVAVAALILDAAPGIILLGGHSVYQDGSGFQSSDAPAGEPFKPSAGVPASGPAGR